MNQGPSSKESPVFLEQWNGVVSKPVFKSIFYLQVEAHPLLNASGVHETTFLCQGDYNLDKGDKQESDCFYLF